MMRARQPQPFFTLGLCVWMLSVVPALASRDSTRLVVEQYPYIGPAYMDYPQAIHRDTWGNTVVAGISQTDSAWMLVVVKYGPDGAKLWSATAARAGAWWQGYPPFRQNSRAVLTGDAGGRVYVSTPIDVDTPPFGQTGITTIAYSPSGDRLWNARFVRSTGGPSYPMAIATDDSGGVWVTGLSEGTSSGADVVTLKYNAAGTQEWLSAYNGLGYALDCPTDIVVDRDGNAYVTGGSTDAQMDLDVFVLKISRNGVRRWVRSYETPHPGQDFGAGILLEGSDRLYVAAAGTGAGTGSDVVTMALDTAGAVLWSAPHAVMGDEVPVDLVSRQGGGVTVLGTTHLCSYSGDGGLLWSARIDTVDRRATLLTSLTRDQAGRLVVAGFASFLAVYDTLGYPEWVAPLRLLAEFSRPLAVTCGTGGRIHLLAMDMGDFVTGVIGPARTVEWRARFTYVENPWGRVTGMAVSADATAWIAGTERAPAQTADYLLRAWDRSGSWRPDPYPAFGYGGGNDGATGIVMDGAGNAIVTGWSAGSTGATDWATLKWAPGGTISWSARYDGPAHGPDSAFSVAGDPAGNVYATGVSPGTAPGQEYCTVKYSPTGTELWVARTGSPNGGDARPCAIVVDSLGYAYVTGTTTSLGGGKDIMTVCYTPSGSQHWVAVFDGTARGADVAAGMVLDDQRRLWVTGSSESAGADTDMLVVTYAANGGLLWSDRLDGPGHGPDAAAAIRSYPGGGAVVAGSVTAADGSRDILTVLFESGGGRQWIRTATSLPGYTEQAAALAVDEAGSIYVAGSAADAEGTGRAVIMKYAPDGTDRWRTDFNSAGNFRMMPVAMGVTSAGDVYVAGDAIWPGGSLPVLLKYEQVLVGVDEPDAPPSRVIRLGQNYPNPFNPVTSIPLVLPEATRIRLSVSSVLGAEVRLLVDAEMPSGEHRFSWDGRNGAGTPLPSGLYFYSVEAAGLRAVRKMLLMR